MQVFVFEIRDEQLGSQGTSAMSIRIQPKAASQMQMKWPKANAERSIHSYK